MLCSVNSTPILCSVTSRLVSAISSLRSFGAMPAVGSSISSSFGSVGERDGEFDALHVAISEHAASAVRACAAMPTWSSSARASSA